MTLSQEDAHSSFKWLKKKKNQRKAKSPKGNGGGIDADSNDNDDGDGMNDGDDSGDKSEEHTASNAAAESKHWVQCSNCKKWRRVPEAMFLQEKNKPCSNRWFCIYNRLHDPAHSTCDAAQEADVDEEVVEVGSSRRLDQMENVQPQDLSALAERVVAITTPTMAGKQPFVLFVEKAYKLCLQAECEGQMPTTAGGRTAASDAVFQAAGGNLRKALAMLHKCDQVVADTRYKRRSNLGERGLDESLLAAARLDAKWLPTVTSLAQAESLQVLYARLRTFIFSARRNRKLPPQWSKRLLKPGRKVNAISNPAKAAAMPPTHDTARSVLNAGSTSPPLGSSRSSATASAARQVAARKGQHSIGRGVKMLTAIKWHRAHSTASSDPSRQKKVRKNDDRDKSSASKRSSSLQASRGKKHGCTQVSSASTSCSAAAAAVVSNACDYRDDGSNDDDDDEDDDREAEDNGSDVEFVGVKRAPRPSYESRSAALVDLVDTVAMQQEILRRNGRNRAMGDDKVAMGAAGARQYPSYSPEHMERMQQKIRRQNLEWKRRYVILVRWMFVRCSLCPQSNLIYV